LGRTTTRARKLNDVDKTEVTLKAKELMEFIELVKNRKE